MNMTNHAESDPGSSSARVGNRGSRRARLRRLLVRVTRGLIGVLAWTEMAASPQEVRIDSVTRQGDQLKIVWSGPSGWSHAVQRAPGLPANEWTEVGTVPAGATAANEMTVALPPGAAQGYYRVVGKAPVGGLGPRLFFTDLESGPNTGGQDDLGAFVTLYGEGFGAERGTSAVTVGGREVARYVVWGEDNAARRMDMVVVQLGPGAVSGDLRVVVNARSSNPLPFVVRPGGIYFVVPGAPNASDANPGTYARPFKTVYRPRAVMQAGDIVYVKGGRIDTIDQVNPSWDAILMLDADSGSASGSAQRPVAYVGYPGDSPLLGSLAARRGIMLATGSDPQSHYVFANLRWTQARDVFPLTGTGHRVIGNTIEAAGADPSGSIGVNGDSSRIRVLGNRLRNNGLAEEKLTHGFYIGGYGTNRVIEFGWNEVVGQRGGRPVQLFGHLDGDWMDDVLIHDNWLLGSELNNLVIGGSDGVTDVIGTVHVYNNVIADASEAGLRVNDPRGSVMVQNNVFYRNGVAQVYLQRAGGRRVAFRNNILFSGSGQSYHAFEGGGADSASLEASHNLYFNAGPRPPWDANSIEGDPRFVDPAALDFRLLPGSPAIDTGVDTTLPFDHAGVSRPQGSAYDMGILEFVPGP